MKIIYFSPYFPPEKTAGGHLVLDLLEGFAKQGWDVAVYTPTPTRGVSEEERTAYQKKRMEMLFGGKVIVHRIPLYREGTRFSARAIRFFVFSFQCLMMGIFSSADVIFTGSVPPSQGIVVSLLHKITKKKIVYNPQDLFPDSMINANMTTENSLAVRVWRKIECDSYRHADLIITIAEDMKKTILTRCADPTKVHVVRNWIDVAEIRPVPREQNRLFDDLGLSRDCFYVTYAGNLGKVQGIDTIIEAAEQLIDHPAIHFVIIGNGSEEKRIQAILQERKMRNVSMFPLLSADRIAEVYSLGDLSIVSCKSGTGKAGMPSKLVSILAAGTGVVASFDRGGELETVLAEARCGLCVDAGNAADLAQTILRLSLDREETKRLGISARRYAEQVFSKQEGVGKYTSLLQQLTSNT